MNGLLVGLIVFTLFVCGFFGAVDYRVALAEDIENGTLIRTNSADTMINNGDGYLGSVTSYNSRSYAVDKYDLFRAFIAKVWFERARLEMEMSR